jgi:hypothetical protein
MTLKRKVYKVTFGEVLKGDIEYSNAYSKTVLAETADRAIEVAKDLLTKRESRTCFAAEVTLITELDAD